MFFLLLQKNSSAYWQLGLICTMRLLFLFFYFVCMSSRSTQPPHEESTHKKTPHEKLESIVTGKKHWLLQDPKTPTRIRSLLDHARDRGCTAEIIAHIVFPSMSKVPKELQEARQISRGFMVSALGSSALKDKEFSRLKSEIQRAEHLTEHTRLTILNVLDEIHKK